MECKSHKMVVTKGTVRHIKRVPDADYTPPDIVDVNLWVACEKCGLGMWVNNPALSSHSATIEFVQRMEGVDYVYTNRTKAQKEDEA